MHISQTQIALKYIAIIWLGPCNKIIKYNSRTIWPPEVHQTKQKCMSKCHDAGAWTSSNVTSLSAATFSFVYLHCFAPHILNLVEYQHVLWICLFHEYDSLLFYCSCLFWITACVLVYHFADKAIFGLWSMHIKRNNIFLGYHFYHL